MAVARAVIDHLTDRPSDDAGGHGGGGFMSWVTDVPDGDDWLNALAALVGGYDWRAKPRDVLRSMYESVIDKPQRKAFGEYYTPDWLAGMVCEQVLDSEWCVRAVRSAVPDSPGAQRYIHCHGSDGPSTATFPTKAAAMAACEQAGTP